MFAEAMNQEGGNRHLRRSKRVSLRSARTTERERERKERRLSLQERKGLLLMMTKLRRRLLDGSLIAEEES